MNLRKVIKLFICFTVISNTNCLNAERADISIGGTVPFIFHQYGLSLKLGVKLSTKFRTNFLFDALYDGPIDFIVLRSADDGIGKTREAKGPFVKGTSGIMHLDYYFFRSSDYHKKPVSNDGRIVLESDQI